MATALIVPIVQAEVAALPTEVKLVRAAFTGLAQLFHHHKAAATAAASTEVSAADPATQMVVTTKAVDQTMTVLMAAGPLLAALAKEFGGITIAPADLPAIEANIRNAVLAIAQLSNLAAPGIANPKG